jgi:tRNA (guanine37-N1)-methyltransferase
LGNSDSAVNESFSSGGLDFPQYTRPAEFRGMAVPEVLLSGDHARIREWRRQQAEARTGSRRPDLAAGARPGEA